MLDDRFVTVAVLAGGCAQFGRTALLWSRMAPPGRPHRLLVAQL